MKRILPVLAVLGGALAAVPAALAAPTAVTVTSNGKAIAVPQTLAPGATTFTFRYSKAKGSSSPALLKLGAGADPAAVLADVRKLGQTGPEKILAKYRATLVASADEIRRGAAVRQTVALSEGTYLMLDVAKGKKSFGSTFTVPAPAGAVEPLPAGRLVTMSDFKVRAPKRVAAGAAWRVRNTGPSLHFLFALSVPKQLSDKAAVKAIRTNDEKAFAKSAFAEVIGLVSPGTTTVVTPNLKRGRWVVVCFYANAKSHGQPHAMLGMEKVIRVR
jgi:hypothetical protein